VTGNATSGFVNQTSNLVPNGASQEAGIRWQIENDSSFSPATNYSRILYRQFADGSSGGSQAQLEVTVYGLDGCVDSGQSTSEADDPWYGFSCFSGAEGDCTTLPYGIASFNIGPASASGDKGKCWVSAKEGSGPKLGLSGTMSTLAVILTGLWAML